MTIDTIGYPGSIYKSARIYTNDPLAKGIRLTVKARVKMPILVSENHITLLSAADQPAGIAIEVRANLDRPLELTPGEFDLEGKAEYEISAVEEGRVFKVVLRSVPGKTQNYRGILVLKTNYPERPELMIMIQGDINQADSTS